MYKVTSKIILISLLKRYIFFFKFDWLIRFDQNFKDASLTNKNFSNKTDDNYLDQIVSEESLVIAKWSRRDDRYRTFASLENRKWISPVAESATFKYTSHMCRSVEKKLSLRKLYDIPLV